jgi:hypothetical protein
MRDINSIKHDCNNCRDNKINEFNDNINCNRCYLNKGFRDFFIPKMELIKDNYKADK